MTRTRRLLAVLTLSGVVLAACGGDSGDEAAGAGGDQTPSQQGSGQQDAAEDAVAALSLFDDAAELALAEAAETFTPAMDGDDVAVGDTVRTDSTGFAQLDFVDGSLARLDTDTTLTVVALGEVDAPTVELDLDVGRVWNSVRDLDADSAYRITTDVGTAAVRGTVFIVWVRADGSTLVATYDGEVVFTTTDGQEYVLGPGDALELGPDGSTDGAAPVPDTLASDPFVIRNQRFDETGEDPGADVGQPSEALAGDYRVTYTMTTPPEVDTQLTADSYGGQDPYVAIQESAFNGLPLEVGGSSEVVWTIGTDGLLVADVPPRVTIMLSTGPSSFEGGYERRDVGPVEQCENTPNIQTNLTTIEVEESDGQVISFTGTQVDGNYIQDAGTCINLRHTTVWELVGERIGPPDEARLDEFRG